MNNSKDTIIKSFLAILFVLLTNDSFSQSRREQIEILNIRLDSLSQLIGLERSVIVEKTNQINILKSELSKLNSDFEKINYESKFLKHELDSKQKMIIDLQTQLTLKNDSLNEIKINLENHKSITLKKFMMGSRELKLGDTINFEDPETYRWEQVDMSPHYVLYRTPDGWEIQIGGSGDRYLKIESITPP
jgi:hypothetical protein